MSTLWTNYNYQTPEEKKLKLSVRSKVSPKKCKMDLKASRRIGLSSKTRKPTSPVIRVKNPLETTPPTKTPNGKTGKQLSTKTSCTNFNETNPQLNGTCVSHTASIEQVIQGPEQNSRCSTTTAVEPHKLGSDISDEHDFDFVKCVIQNSADKHVECSMRFKECARKFNESSDQLRNIIEIVKRYLPSVLNSLPSEVSQTLEDLNNQTENAQEDQAMGGDSIFKKDAYLVQQLMFVLKEFNSYALVLEKHPEGVINKETLLNVLKAKEELFEQSLIKFKENKSWLLNTGIKTLETTAQRIVQMKYANYFEMLDMELKTMKAKRSQLAKIVNIPVNGNESLSDSEHAELKITSQTLNSDDNDSLSFLRKSDDGVNEVIEEFEKPVLEINESREIIIEDYDLFKFNSEQSRRGKSLPVLDDMMSDDSLAEISSYSLTSGSSEEGIVQNTQPQMDSHQGKENIQYTLETLISEVEPQEPEAQSPNIGSHFLASQVASVCSPTSQGFLYKVDLSPTKKAYKNPLIPVSNTTNQCSECNEIFHSIELLNSHKLLTHVTRLCNLCSAICSNMSALKEHVATSHMSHILCSECGIIIEGRNITAHAATHFKIDSAIEEKLMCRACSSTFSSMEQVKKHENEHKDAFYRCKHCGELFLTQLEVQEHGIVHLAEGFVLCKVCYLDFNHKSRLFRHLRAAHNMVENKSPENYECLLCYQPFSNEMELILHIRHKHESDDLVIRASSGKDDGAPKSKCSVCQSYFDNGKVRAVHEVIFHEIPPYRCNCNMAFFTKAMLDQHVLKHTRVQEENIKKPRRGKSC